MNDDKLRDALPFLRPRIEEPSAIILLIFALLCVGLVALVAYHLISSFKERQKRQLKLREAGAAKGLNKADIALLNRLSNQMTNPIQLVESLYVFDRAIAPYLNALIKRDWDHKEIRQLARMRQLLGFDQVTADQQLRTTRQLQDGLTVMIWCEAQETEAFYPWVLVRREERALVLVPLLREDFARYETLDAGRVLAVRFWRSRDTEYRFEASIISVDRDEHAVVLHHSDSMTRLQQRDFYRIYVHFEIPFFLQGKASSDLKEGDMPEDPDRDMPVSFAERIDATVLDLSAGGLSIETLTVGPLECTLIVDPHFAGPFPLAGLACQIVQQTRVGQANRLQLRFDTMPAAREAELVRCVYEHQLQQARATEEE